MSVARVMALSLLIFGAALHTYTHAVEASSFSLWFWLLSLSPYIAGAVLLFVFKRPHATAGALLLPAFLDAGTFYSAFIDPQSSTASLGLGFVPFLNIFVLVPIGGAIGWWIGYRIRLTNDEMPSNKSLERTREG
jgi:hypothetical protein